MLGGMKVEVFQHVPFEGLGSIGTWLADRAATVRWTRWFEEGAEASVDPHGDLLVVLGGPMSVNDPLPWLEREREAIRGAIDAGVPVLGICLGAQQIARALGAAVAPCREREIGWGEIEGNPFASGPFADLFAGRMAVFHWHGEGCELPEGAERLAASRFCPVQAFSVGGKVLGIQFHLETTPESAAAMVEHCGDDLRPGRAVQPADEILDHTDYATGHEWMARVLERLVD